MRPLYRVHIGDIGQSNALQIARRLQLPGHIVDRGFRYLQESRGRELPEMAIVQKLRKDAEAAHRSALAPHKPRPSRSREAARPAARRPPAPGQRERRARITEARERLQPGDRVVVPKMGYDRPGRVVKIDPRKKVATVAIGAMQWDVPIAELRPAAHPQSRAGREPRTSRSRRAADDRHRRVFGEE